MTIRTIEMPKRERAAKAMPSTLNIEERSFELTWATDAPVAVEIYDPERGYVFVDEVLSMEPGHVRTARMDAGLPLLDHHNRWHGQLGQVGKVRECKISEGAATGKAFLSKREWAQEFMQDVQDGLADTFSAGYRVYAYEVTRREGQRDLYRAVDWEPMEVSFEPVPADIGARTRNADSKGSCELRMADETEIASADTNESPKAPESAQTTKDEERSMKLTPTDIKKLLARGADLGLGLDIVNAVLAAGEDKTLEECTDDLTRALKDKREREERAAKTPSTTTEQPTPSTQARTGHMEITAEQAEKDGAGIIAYLEHRATGGELKDEGRRFMGMSMVDLCRKVLTDRGQNPAGNRFELVREALLPQRLVRRTMSGVDRERDVGGLHTTSDFGDLLGDGVLRRRLLAAYNSAPDNFSAFVSNTTFADPRTQKFIRVGGIAQLGEVKEGAEYKRKTFGTETEELSIEKYGGIIGLSLEAILRDDLSAFARLPTTLGRAAKKTESAIVFKVLTDNDALSDNIALFESGTHGNIGSASAPDMTGITDARTKMRKQKDVALTEATARLGITPRHIVIPYKYELGLAQLVGPDRNSPDATTDIVPRYIRDMTYSVSDVLDANSSQIWYAFADPSEVECIVVARLEGNQPFEIERRTGWEVDGLEWKIRHWFGAGAVDYRGVYRNPGV